MYVNNTVYRQRLPYAVGGNFVWTDKKYKFVDLPKSLYGARYFRTPESIPEGSEIKILIHRPTSIYITSTFWSAYDYKDALTQDDWIMLSKGSSEVSMATPDDDRVLEKTWKKTFEEFAMTVIKLPTRAKKFEGIIFIKGKVI